MPSGAFAQSSSSQELSTTLARITLLGTQTPMGFKISRTRELVIHRNLRIEVRRRQAAQALAQPAAPNPGGNAGQPPRVDFTRMVQPGGMATIGLGTGNPTALANAMFTRVQAANKTAERQHIDALDTIYKTLKPQIAIADPTYLGTFRSEPLVPLYKQQPYLPAGDRLVAHQDFNGMQVVPPENSVGGDHTAAVCHHIAHGYFEAPDKRAFLNDVTRNAAAMRAFFSAEFERVHDAGIALERETPEVHKHLVDEDALGKYFQAIADSLQWRLPPHDAGREEVDLKLLSHDHAMAAQVQAKRDGPGSGVRICISFFDPNKTSTHLRMEADAGNGGQAIGALKFSDLVPPRRLEEYRGPHGRLTFCALAPDIELEDAQTAFAHLGSGAPPVAAELAVALRSGMPSTIREVGTRLPLVTDPDEKLNLLRAMLPGGTPSLFVAMQNDHGDAVHSYAEIVRGSGLSSAQRAVLLGAPCTSAENNSYTGLFMAVLKGCENSARALLEAVRGGSFSAPEKLWLIAAQTREGHTTLSACTGPQQAVVAKMLLGCMRDAGLDSNDHARLLMMRPAGRLPPLHTALAVGHAPTIQSFVDGIAQLPLSQAQKEYIVAAPAGNIPAIAHAATQGNHGMIRRWADAAEALAIAPQRMLEWLAVPPGGGQSGLLPHVRDNATRTALNDVIARQQQRLQQLQALQRLEQS